VGVPRGPGGPPHSLCRIVLDPGEELQLARAIAKMVHMHAGFVQHVQEEIIERSVFGETKVTVTRKLPAYQSNRQVMVQV
jgi:hypothetical protein